MCHVICTEITETAISVTAPPLEAFFKLPPKSSCPTPLQLSSLSSGFLLPTLYPLKASLS